MPDLSPWVEIVKSFLERAKKTGELPTVDPTEIAKCVKDLQLKLMDLKLAYVKISSGTGTLDENLLFENMRKMTSNIKFKVKKKKTTLKIPIGKEEYTYEFAW